MDEIVFQEIERGFSEFMSNLGTWISDHGLPIVGILIGAWLVMKFGTQVTLRLLKPTIRHDIYPTKLDRQKRLNTLEGLIKAMLKIVTGLVALIMIVSEIGLNATPILASAGIAGVALGFGAQSLIKDLTSGLFIILENQYRVGDVVELDNLVTGTVVGINLRSTIIRSLDGRLYHVPNGTIQWAANRTSTYGGIEEDIVVGVDTDITKLRLVVNRVGQEIANDPTYAAKIVEAPQFLRVDSYTPNGLLVKVVAKTGSDDSFEIKGVLYERLITALRKAKIEIPLNPVTIIETKKSAKK